MPVMDGVTATTAIQQELPYTEIQALTSTLDDASVVDAVHVGAIGYLLKSTEVADVVQAIKSAAAGQVQFSPEAAGPLMRGVEPAGTPGCKLLAKGETDVLRLLAKGLANKKIATELSIGETTMKTHVSNILTKLSLQSPRRPLST